MLAVCESCLPTLSKLRESVSGLRADLMERDKILMDFSTVAATQAKVSDAATRHSPKNIRRWRTEHDSHGQHHPAMDRLHQHRDFGTNQVPLAPPGSQAQDIGTLHSSEGDPGQWCTGVLGLLHLLLLRLQICHWITGLTS